MTPRFIDLAQALRIHQSMIEHYGGADGLRDLGLLTSALAMPQASSGGAYLHGDLFEMAAAYLYHIARNHPFVDGNKRTAAATAIIFLSLNGVALEASEDELVETTLSVAAGGVSKDHITGFLRANSR